MKTKIWLIFIIALGLILRLIFIDKPEGLWNDEYVSWMIAATPFGQGFWDAVRAQCHMPFYYLYLKFFIVFFGQSDLVLRLSSVLAGCGGIIAMYFAGAEKNRVTGLLCAGFTALSSFLIYYSQEVRLYSVLFLFSALALLYTLRLVRFPDRKNAAFWFVWAFMLMFTHTIGFVFVFCNLLALSVMLLCHRASDVRSLIKYLWLAVGAAGLCLAPLVCRIFAAREFSQWWGSFSAAKIWFFVTDYFSPVLTNLTNSPDKVFFNLFMWVPAIIALVFLFKSLFSACRFCLEAHLERRGSAACASEQNPHALLLTLFGMAAAVLLVLIAAASTGKLVFLTKYTIEIYPVLIFLVCCAEFKKNALRNALAGVYCVACLFYMVSSPKAAFKIPRSEGHKIAAKLLENAQLKPGDLIILEYYPQERFSKYFDFSPYKVVSLNKSNFAEYISPDVTYSDVYTRGRKAYAGVFAQDENAFFAGKIDQIIKNLPPGKNTAVLLLDSVAFFNREQVKTVNAPVLFLVFSYIRNQSVSELIKHMQVLRFETQGDWSLVKFTKR